MVCLVLLGLVDFLHVSGPFVQHSTAQHSTAQHSTAQHVLETQQCHEYHSLEDTSCVAHLPKEHGMGIVIRLFGPNKEGHTEHAPAPHIQETVPGSHLSQGPLPIGCEVVGPINLYRYLLTCTTRQDRSYPTQAFAVLQLVCLLCNSYSQYSSCRSRWASLLCLSSSTVDFPSATVGHSSSEVHGQLILHFSVQALLLLPV